MHFRSDGDGELASAVCVRTIDFEGKDDFQRDERELER